MICIVLVINNYVVSDVHQQQHLENTGSVYLPFTAMYTPVSTVERGPAVGDEHGLGPAASGDGGTELLTLSVIRLGSSAVNADVTPALAKRSCSAVDGGADGRCTAEDAAQMQQQQQQSDDKQSRSSRWTKLRSTVQVLNVECSNESKDLPLLYCCL